MAESPKSIYKVKPFLRWAGGKKWLIKDFNKFLPEKFNNYYEPFLGGGAVFLHLVNSGLLNKDVYLSDINSDLINTYKVLQRNPDELFNELLKYKNTKDEYYAERGKKYSDDIQSAAKFIYLNRTSFNGLYRVNRKNEYNVPYGFKKYKTLFEFDNLQKISNLLTANIHFNASDFEALLPFIKEHDLVFIDPPYTVAHGKNGFLKYNQSIFAWEDQIRLKTFIRQVNDRGAFFIMTNASHISIKELFNFSCGFEELQRASLIGGRNAKRGAVYEYIYFNTKQY